MTDTDREPMLDPMNANDLTAEGAGSTPQREALLAAHPDVADDPRASPRRRDPLARPSGAFEATVQMTGSRPALPQETHDFASNPGAAISQGATAVTPPGDNGAGLPRGARVRYFGDYEINEELGRGGMGVVYRARQVTLNRPVALKMIKAGALADESELRRFQNEAEAVALLDHPGIVPVYEVGERDGQRYFSMKVIAGGSLAERLDAYKNDPKAAARLVAEVAEAVSHAHQRGILHRDIKPANILLDEGGNPHVTDFGLAKRVTADAEMTASGAILGTPGYMAPEQASGHRGSITTATDVYGLGALLYAVLTGQAPFASDNVVNTLSMVREQPPESLRKRNALVPRDLEVIALKCLEKDPRRRYSSSQALAGDLRAWLESRPITARPVGPLTRTALWCKRRPALAGLLIALVLALVGASVLSLVIARQQTGRAREQAVAAHNERVLRDQAVAERDRAARQAYTSATNLAWREWHDGNPARTRSLLQSTRPGGGDDLDFRGFEWFFLDRLGHTPLWSSGAKGTLRPSIALSADRTWVAVARDRGVGRPGDIVFLDARDGRETRSIGANRLSSSRIVASPDGAWIASTSQDRSAVIWDARSGAEHLRVPGGPNGPPTVSLSHDGRRLAWLQSPSGSGGPGPSVIKIWDLAEKREIRSIPLTPHARQFVFSQDWGRLATTSQTALEVWDASTGKVAWQEETKELFTDITFSPDGRLMAAATFNGWIGFWDAAAGARIGTLAGHRGEIHRIRFSPDGKSLASGGRDRVVRIWDVSDSRLRLELRGHESDIWDVAFTTDGTRLASSSLLDGIVKLWDLERGQESVELSHDSPSPVRLPTFGLAFSPDGRELVAAGAAGALQAWRTERKTPLFKMDNKDMAGRNWVAIGPGSDVLATLDEKRFIVLRDAMTGAPIRTLDSSDGSRVGAISPDGQHLAVGHDSSPTIRIWELASGRLTAVLQGHTQPVECLAFSPDGKKLASGSFDATVRIWDFPSGGEPRVYRGHSAAIAAVAFHPDGHRLASASMDDRLAGEIQLWDAATGQDLQSLRGHSSFVRRLSFLPDGRRLVSLGDDGVLKLWDHEPGQEVLSIAAHSRNGLGLAVSPDGRHDRDLRSGIFGATLGCDANRPGPMSESFRWHNCRHQAEIIRPCRGLSRVHSRDRPISSRGESPWILSNTSAAIRFRVGGP